MIRIFQIPQCTRQSGSHTLLVQSVNRIESVQHRAAWFTLGRYRRTSTVTAMLAELNWQPLAQCRRVARLTMFYKIHYNLAAINMPLILKVYSCPTCTKNKIAQACCIPRWYCVISWTCHSHCMKLNTGYSTVLYSVGSCTPAQRSWTITVLTCTCTADPSSYILHRSASCLHSSELAVIAIVSTIVHAPEFLFCWSGHYCWEEKQKNHRPRIVRHRSASPWLHSSRSMKRWSFSIVDPAAIVLADWVVITLLIQLAPKF